MAMAYSEKHAVSPKEFELKNRDARRGSIFLMWNSNPTQADTNVEVSKFEKHSEP